MRSPMYGLFVSPDAKKREDILSGTVTGTVREGYREYKEGPVLLSCHVDPWVVLAVITRVRHCPVRALSEKEVRACGFTNHKELLTNLREFYADIGMSSAVTFVEWSNVQGKLVDEQQR